MCKQVERKCVHGYMTMVIIYREEIPSRVVAVQEGCLASLHSRFSLAYSLKPWAMNSPPTCVNREEDVRVNMGIERSKVEATMGPYGWLELPTCISLGIQTYNCITPKHREPF